MSVSIQNNNIQVTDSSNVVIFDTSTPMPHITNVITNTINHTFPNTTHSTSTNYGVTWNACSYFEFTSNYEYICNNEYVCNWECTYSYYDGFSCSNVCGWQNVCGYEYVSSWGWFTGNGEDSATRGIAQSSDNGTVYTIGSVDTGLDPDFLLVEATFSRTTSGGQVDFGTFVSSLKTGSKVIANGSTVVETAFAQDGDPWLTRLVSVYLDGDDVKAEFKHSNKEYTSLTVNYGTCCPNPRGYSCNPGSSFPATRDISSVWSVSFKIYVGKFTI